MAAFLYRKSKKQHQRRNKLHWRCKNKQPDSDAGIGGETAVDGDDDARDEGGCLVVQKEQQRAVQLLAFTEAAHRGGGKDRAGARRGRAVRVPQQSGVLDVYKRQLE